MRICRHPRRWVLCAELSWLRVPQGWCSSLCLRHHPGWAVDWGQMGSSVGCLPLLAAGNMPLAGTELPRGDAGGGRGLICAISFRS